LWWGSGVEAVTIHEILNRFERVKKISGGWTVRCPVHEDRTPSLSISEGREGIVLKCHAGCETEDIVAAVGLQMADLFYDVSRPQKNEDPPLRKTTRSGAALRTDNFQPDAPSDRQVDAIYDYTDAEGQLLYQVVRYTNKDFLQRRPDGDGGWIWDLEGITPVLYRLPDLLAAIKQHLPVIVVEGEKDVETLRAAGAVATTSSGGAGKWRSEYAAYFEGAVVVVLRDYDEPGRKHRLDIAESLYGHALSLLCPDLPGLTEKPGSKDVTDWFAMGHTLDELMTLATKADQWKPDTIPDIERTGDDYTGRWPRLGITVKAANVHDEHREGLKCYLRVDWTHSRIPLVSQTFNLSSGDARVKLIHRLDKKKPGPDVSWDQLIEYFCHEVVERQTTLPSAEPLAAEPRKRDFYDIESLLGRAHLGMLIAAGDTGKSMLGLYLATLGALGRPGIGPFRITRRLRWLYLDWERTKEFHASRLSRIKDGLGLSPLGAIEGLEYQKLRAPLVDAVGQIRAMADKCQADIISIDSAGLASGDDPETARAALKVCGALQSIGKTALLLHHVNKGDALNGSSATRQLSAYGSVYWENEVLVAWSMELLRDPGSTRHIVLLRQKKNNDGAYHPDFGLEFDHQGGKLVVRTTDLDTHPELLDKMPLNRQLIAVLKSGPMTYPELAEATGSTESGVRSTCYRLRRARRIVSIPNSDPVKVGLAAMDVSK
jgi:hypothetical protein